MGWKDLKGRTWDTPQSASRSNAQITAERGLEQDDADQKERMAVADKIVLAIIDRISQAIIRPGPQPEERECYVMAKELRDFSPELSAMVAEILRIEADEA